MQALCQGYRRRRKSLPLTRFWLTHPISRSDNDRTCYPLRRWPSVNVPGHALLTMMHTYCKSRILIHHIHTDIQLPNPLVLLADYLQVTEWVQEIMIDLMIAFPAETCRSSYRTCSRQ